MKIVFFGTSIEGVPVLEALSQAHEVVLVVTKPDSTVGRKREITQSDIAGCAERLGLRVVKPEKVKGNEDFLGMLKTLGADVFVVVSYGKILPLGLLTIPPFKTLNVHFSLLPKYRGASPLQSALLAGDTETGVSIFELDELVDHGPVYIKSKVPVTPSDTYTSLSQKLSDLSAPLLLDLLDSLTRGEASAHEQEHDEATFTKIFTKEDGFVDFTQTSTHIQNMCRAFSQWPQVWTRFHGQLFKVLECETMPGTSPAEPGTVLDGGVVICGAGTLLQLKTVQLEGKKPASVQSFINGHQNFVGSKLGE